MVNRAVEIFNREKVAMVLHAGDYVAPFSIKPLFFLEADFMGVWGNNDGDKIALITTKDFKTFKQMENPMPPSNRNCVIFPRKIDGEFAMLHRPSDLGHTPFGHAGEAVLDQLHPGGFRHFFQSLRVVEILEKEGRGLNLSLEVRDGIVKHSKGKGDILSDDPNCTAFTLEGQIVRLADIVAYVNHDIDDAIRARVIDRNDIPAVCRRLLGERNSQRINTMVTDIIDRSSEADGRLMISPEILEAISLLRDFLYERVYDSTIVHTDFIKAKRLLEDLYQFFIDNPDTFRERYYQSYLDTASLEQNVCDFIAGMTDRYAFSLYEKIFLPQPWLIK